MKSQVIPRTLCFFVICLLGGLLLGQTPGEEPASATITFANGESITIGSNSEQIFNPVDVLAGEALGIAMSLPQSFVNNPVGMQPMDGGFVPEEIEVGADGSTAFVFQAGSQPGLYRIILRTIDSSVLLQFSVPNPEHP